MKKLWAILALTTVLIVAAIDLTGCSTVKKGVATGKKLVGPALDVAAMTNPQYASVINQIKAALATDERSPIEGFDFTITYRYEGRIVEAKDITWEESWTRIGSADKGMPPASVAKPITDTPEDEQLKEKIGSILDAAGITEEGSE